MGRLYGRQQKPDSTRPNKAQNAAWHGPQGLFRVAYNAKTGPPRKKMDIPRQHDTLSA